MNKQTLLIAAVALLGATAYLIPQVHAQPPLGQFQLEPIIGGGSGGGGSTTTPGGTVTGANQYRSASGTFAGDNLILDDGAGRFNLVGISATDTISASMFTATGPGNATSVQVGLGSGTKGFYSGTASRLVTAAGGVNAFTFTNTGNTSQRALGVRGDGGGDFTPQATLDVMGPIRMTGVGTACTVSNTGAYRDTTTYNSIARCNGTNWIVLASTTITITTTTP